MKRPILCIILASSIGVAEAQERSVADKKFWAVAGVMHASMIVDGVTTYQVFEHCPSGWECYERNPLAKPFIDSGPKTAYFVGTAIQAGIMTTSYYMKKSKNPFLRKTWWVVPIVVTSAHLALAQRNYVRIGSTIER